MPLTESWDGGITGALPAFGIRNLISDDSVYVPVGEGFPVLLALRHVVLSR
jgi:hypothetical protein